jgi:hypothetical protein
MRVAIAYSDYLKSAEGSTQEEVVSLLLFLLFIDDLVPMNVEHNLYINRMPFKFRNELSG